MKICVFGDVHGNFQQFEKLTKTSDFLNADKRICLGDMVGLGPYQKECVDLLYKFDNVFLLGNHEARMTKLIDDLKPDVDFEIYNQFEMYRKQLKDYLPIFDKLPRDYVLNVAGKKIYFTHYGWHNNDMANKDVALKNASLTKQFKINEDEYDYVVYGHVHTPSEKVEGKTKFIDVGSLGLKSPSNYMMIEEENGNLKISRKSLEFDIQKFLKECEKLNYPKWEQLKNFGFDNKIEKNTGTVLVTGGAGYIGTNITLKLAQKGYKVIIVDNFSNSHKYVIKNLQDLYPSNIKVYEFDLLDTKKLENLFEKENIYSVIHLAGKKYVPESFEKEEEYYLNNVSLTKNLLEIMKQHKINNIVFSSSISVYGKTSTRVVAETEKTNPLSPYASQKRECEKLIKEWQKGTNSNAVILRLSNPVGANIEYTLGDNSKATKFKGIMPYILESAREGKRITLNGGDHPTKDGTTIRDYVHVEDVANAFVGAVEKGDGQFNIYNIGSGEPGYSVLDILHQAEESLNKGIEYSFGPKRAGDASIFISDNSKAKKNLGFKVTKNLKDMVESQIDFEEKIKTDISKDSLFRY